MKNTEKSPRANGFKVIGLTGQPLSGKDTAAGFFVMKGFAHFSCGDILREEMRKQGLPVDRAHTGPFATKMKQERGNAYLAELAAEKVTGNAVISGLRAALEVEALHQRFGDDFILLCIDAPIEDRYERAQKRGREGDHITFEEFRRIEENERSDASGALEVDKVIALADRHIDNSGTIDGLYAQLATLLGASKA